MDRRPQHDRLPTGFDPPPEPVSAPVEAAGIDFCDADFGSDIALTGETDLTGLRAMPVSVDLWTLSRFKTLMAIEGWPVQTARMVFDRVYAHERLAFGHTSANGALRALSLEIFRRMHAHDPMTH